jgi:hypothetical protein
LLAFTKRPLDGPTMSKVALATPKCNASNLEHRHPIQDVAGQRSGLDGALRKPR